MATKWPLKSPTGARSCVAKGDGAAGVPSAGCRQPPLILSRMRPLRAAPVIHRQTACGLGQPAAVRSGGASAGCPLPVDYRDGSACPVMSSRSSCSGVA